MWIVYNCGQKPKDNRWFCHILYNKHPYWHIYKEGFGSFQEARDACMEEAHQKQRAERGVTHHFQTAEVVQEHGFDCLYVRGKFWASSSEIEWYNKYLAPHAHGTVLEFGLGLGVASRALLKQEAVLDLITVEQESDVVRLFTQMNFGYRQINNGHVDYLSSGAKRHCIVNDDQFDFANQQYVPMYDTVFMDTWTAVDKTAVRTAFRMHELLKANKILRPTGKFIAWFGDYQDKFLECGEDYARFIKVVPN